MPITIDGLLMDGITRSYIPTKDLTIDPSLTLHRDAAAEIDGITYEVLRHRLWNINEEHGDTIVKVSGSPIAVYGKDFNPCIMTEDGEFVFFGPYLQYHSGVQDLTVKWILENRSANPGIREGDMFLSNDPWVGATHQSDTNLFCPVFVDGELFCWVGNTLHFADLGGSRPGGWSPDAQSVYEEPVPVPPIKIVEGGVLRRDLADSWVRRSRLPELTALDLRATIAGNNVARDRMLALIKRYGAPTVKRAMRKILDDSERAFLERLRSIPDGVWRDQGYVEVRGPGDRGVYKGVLTLTKDGDRLLFENAGTAEQGGVINATYAAWRAGILSALNPAFCHDQLYAIGGPLRHIDFLPSPGSFTSANYPGAVSCGPVIGCATSWALATNTLAKMISTSSDAELRREVRCNESITVWPVDSISGTDQWGSYFGNAILDFYASPTGAFSFRDGIASGGQSFGPLEIAPNVEENEQTMPLLYLWRREIEDSGGAGKYVGGATLEVAFTRHGSDDVLHQVTSSGVAVPTSTGIFGGHPGSPVRFLLAEDTTVTSGFAEGRLPIDIESLGGNVRRLAPKAGNLRHEAGAVMIISCPGGAGYGDPLDRDPGAVAEDVVRGYRSIAAARTLFGVVLNEDRTVDYVATEACRSELRDARRAESSSGAENPARWVPRTEGARLTEHVAVVDHEGEAMLSCRVCGQYLGSAADGYKPSAALRERPLTEANPLIADPGEMVDAELVFREFFCPGCMTLIEAEVAPVEEPPFQDVRLLAAWTPTAGAEPVSASTEARA